MYCIITFYCLLPSFLQIHNSELCIFIYYLFFLFILYQAKSHTMDVLILNHYYYYYYYYYIAGFRFLTALVFYSQSDYLNHSHRDIDWLIVTCFMKV